MANHVNNEYRRNMNIKTALVFLGFGAILALLLAMFKLTGTLR